MIESNQKICGFWDGDFSFHVPMYDGDRGATFRVRINQDPEERAQANVRNPNAMRAGWDEIVRATDEETTTWIVTFASMFPRRTPAETEMLRRLRLQGSVDTDGLQERMMQSALRRLSWQRYFYRDFSKKYGRFAQQDDGVYTLTDNGMWLTGLMK